MTKTFTLQNGVNCIYEKKNSHSNATITVLMKVGGINEPNGYHGFSHFVEHLLFQGTDKYKNNMEIGKTINQFGSYINAGTMFDMTIFYVTADPMYFDKAVEVLSDILFHSRFNSKDIEKQKKVVLKENERGRSELSFYLGELLLHIIGKGTLMAHSLGGPDAVIKSATRAKILKYVGNFYTTDNMIVSICGNISLNKTRLLMDKYFNKRFDYDIVLGNVEAGDFAGYDNETINKGLRNFMNLQTEMRYLNKIVPKISTCYVGIGFPATAFGSEDYYVCLVIHSLLGANMSSRLFSVIREKHGLTYTIKSELNNFKEFSVFSINYTTAKKDINKTISLIIYQLSLLSNERVSGEELKKAKRYLIGSNNLNRETTDYRSKSNAIDFSYLGRHRSSAEIYSNIEKVRASDIKRVAKMMFSKNKMNVVVISSSAFRLVVDWD